MNNIFINIYNYFKKRKNKTKLNCNKSIVKNDCASQTYKTYTKFVKKHYDTSTINVYKNEKKWLLKLQNSIYFPTLLYYNDNLRMLITTDMGKPLDKNDLININIHEKINDLLQELKKYNCRHNDIKPTELVFKNGNINLVDFGWAYEYNKSNPPDWPNCLGGKFRGDVYDDEFSINKSIISILLKV